MKKKDVNMKNPLILILGATSLVALGEGTTPVDVLDPSRIGVHASALNGPSGMALHPVSGELLVAESSAGRVSRIHEGKAIPVIESGKFVLADDLPGWAYTRDFSRAHWMSAELRSPSALSFSPNGRLFVAENASDGRLLEFLPEPDGRFSTGRVVAVPWLRRGYAWTDVLVADDGRLFLTGHTAENAAGLDYGVALQRDPDGNWWIMDYGPFAGFSAVTLSPKQDVVFLAERGGGAVAWWDAQRREEIGSIEEMLPHAAAMVTFPDGSFMVAQRAAKDAPGGRLVRINPVNNDTRIIAAGLGAIAGAVYDVRQNRILCTEHDTGRILSMPLPNGLLFSGPLIDQLLFGRDIETGRAHGAWPHFLGQFISALGYEPMDPKAVREKRADGTVIEQEGRGFTLEEFTDLIPMVAAKLKVTKPLSDVGADPLEELSCIVFYPGQQMKSGPESTPSLSLFVAKYASGRIERTRELPGLSRMLVELSGTSVEPAALYLPLAACSAQRVGKSHSLTLAFIGADVFDDFYVTLENIRDEKGIVNIKRREGPTEHYEVSYVERLEDGAVQRNLVMAGFNRTNSDPFGWHKLGNSPIPTLLSMTPDQMPFSNKRTIAFANASMKRQQEWELALGNTLDSDDSSVASGTYQTGRGTAPVGKTFSPTEVTDGKRRTLPDKEIATPERPGRKTDRHAEKDNKLRQAEKPEPIQRATTKPDAENVRSKPATPEEMQRLIFSKAVESWNEPKNDASF